MNCVGASSPWARQPADDISPVSVAFGPSVVHSTQPGATTTPGSVQGPLVSSARHTPIASTIPTHPQPSYRSEPPLHYWTPSASAAPDNYANYAIAGYSSPYVDPTCSHGGGVASVNAEPNVRRGMSAAVAHSKPFEPHPYAQYQPRVPMPYAGPYESHGNASPSNAPRTAADGADGGSGLVGGVLDMIGMHEKNLMDERTAAGAISLLDVWASRCESFESALTENTEEDEEEVRWETQHVVNPAQATARQPGGANPTATLSLISSLSLTPHSSPRAAGGGLRIFRRGLGVGRWQ